MLSDNRKIELKELWNKQIPLKIKDLSFEELEYLLNEYYDFKEDEMLDLLNGKFNTVEIISKTYEDVEDEEYQNVISVFKVNNTFYRQEWSYGGINYPEFTDIHNCYKIVKLYTTKDRKVYLTEEEYFEYLGKQSIIPDKKLIVGNNLKTYRIKNGYTLRSLSAKLLEKYNKRITIGAINLIENGKNYPSVETLLILSDFYNVGLDGLFTK